MLFEKISYFRRKVVNMTDFSNICSLTKKGASRSGQHLILNTKILSLFFFYLNYEYCIITFSNT